MSNTKFDDIRSILLKYDIDIVSFIEKDLLCGICKKLLKDPFATICGCTHCNQCISNHLKVKKNYCPGPRSECKDCLLDRNTDIYFDPKTNIRIGNLIGKCPNKLCDVETKLVDMKEHIQICENRKSFCPYFNIGCTDTSITLKTVDSHLSANSVNHAYLLIEHVNNSRNDIDTLMEKYEERLMIQQRKIEDLKMTLDQKNNSFLLSPQQNFDKERKMGSILCLILAFVLAVGYGTYIVGRYEVRLSAQRLQLQHLSNEFKNRDFGEYLWKMENFTEVLSNAKNGKVIKIESDSFYSHKYGYRLKLELYPNGIDYHKNVHLSVRLVLLMGAYDDILKWPFGKGVKINFIDQLTGDDIESIFIHNNGYTYPALRRSTLGRNDSAADLRFDLSSLVKMPGFMKNDLVYLSCSVKRGLL